MKYILGFLSRIDLPRLQFQVSNKESRNFGMFGLKNDTLYPCTQEFGFYQIFKESDLLWLIPIFYALS